MKLHWERNLLCFVLAAAVSLSVGSAFGATNNLAIVSAARSQIGVTVRYVPSYQKLA